MSEYELVAVLAEITRDLKKEQEKIEVAIKEKGGKVEKFESLGAKNFTYPVKKQTSGHYLRFSFSLEEGRISSLKDIFSRNPKLLRALILKKGRRWKPQGKRMYHRDI